MDHLQSCKTKQNIHCKFNEGLILIKNECQFNSEYQLFHKQEKNDVKVLHYF